MFKVRVLVTCMLTVLAGCGATAHAQPQRMTVPAASVTFPAGKDVVEMPFKLERDKMVIPVRVNGSSPLWFVLDTGSPIAGLMNADLAGELGLTATGKVRLGGAGTGSARMVDLAGGVRIELGGIEITNETMVIGVGDGKVNDSGWSGIIGRSVFANLVVEMDFTRQVLRLHAPETFAYAGKGAELPLTLVGGSFPYINVPISVDGGDAVTTSLVIDTGASHALLLLVDSNPDLTLPRHTLEGLIGWGASGPVYGRIGRVASLQLADYVLHNLVASFPDAASMAALPPVAPGGPERQGNLGMKALKRFHVFFDYANTRLILEPDDMIDAPFVFNSAGLIPAPWAEGAARIEVGSVIASSPADLAGIEVGDYIIEIDDKPVAGIDVNRVISLLEQPAGTRLSLKLQRGAEMMERKLTLVSLI
jgi:hypothetical protein